MAKDKKITAAYKAACEKYAALGVDVKNALTEIGKVSLSIHCWQGDDVCGFEKPDSSLSGGGIQVTGNYPGKARNVEELRTDLEKAYSLIPGSHRLNLHAIYGEFGKSFVDRDEISPDHFRGWVQWARDRGINLDFNATLFSHPRADSGFTLSSRDRKVRAFWIEHVDRCRQIAAYMGKECGSPCVHNLWIPDGSKDVPVDRTGPRARLKESLDEIYSKKLKSSDMKDAVESKLFGIGSEAYVVGSHEFYMAYATANNLMICLDMGHFHPTESIADKISSILLYSDEVLVHVSRGVRWDSDHVVAFNDDLRSVAEECVRGGNLKRVNLALDFFDGSINRVGAWVTGARATMKALLFAMLEPWEKLTRYEESGRLFERLALLEEAKSLPFGDVWDYFCMEKDVPAGADWIGDVRKYELAVLKKR